MDSASEMVSRVLDNRAFLSVIVSFLFAALVILLRKFRGSTVRGNALLLVGPSDGGKTALLSTASLCMPGLYK